MSRLFPGTRELREKISGVEIFARIGGSGPPLLLIHGFPQTHAMWHRVAPQLLQHFTCVMPDLRGYGYSSCPPNDAANEAYSKRAMAKDLGALMASLGHERFAVVGHDRGARVGYRVAARGALEDDPGHGDGGDGGRDIGRPAGPVVGVERPFDTRGPGPEPRHGVVPPRVAEQLIRHHPEADPDGAAEGVRHEREGISGAVCAWEQAHW